MHKYKNSQKPKILKLQMQKRKKLKAQTCGNGQNAKMLKQSKGKNAKTVKTQKCEHGQDAKIP